MSDESQITMTRILTSFAIIVAAVAVIAGGTYALLDDEAKMVGATFSAGDLDLKIDKNPLFDEQDFVNQFTVPADYYVKNLYPGFPTNPGREEGQERNWQVIDITNEGSIDGDATVKLKRTSEWSNLSGELTFSISYNDGSVIKTGTLDDLNDQVIPLGALNAGEISTVMFEWSVPTTAGNEIMGDKVKFDVVFGLDQTVVTSE